jgi:hypothetical protein
MIQYGILDDKNVVVRWVWVKPDYPHITRKVIRKRKKKVDLTKFEDAPY